MEEIEWLAIARDDLLSVYEYISRDSAFYAQRLIDKIVGRIIQLEKFPQSGSVVPEYDNEMVRELIDGCYRIVYIIEDDRIFSALIYHSVMILKKLK